MSSNSQPRARRQRRPGRSGRWLAAVAILMTALNLRSVVAGLSPLLPRISQDFAISSLDVGVIGMLPAAAFAVFGYLGPRFTRLRQLESCIVVALLVMVLGLLIRVLSGHFLVLAVGTGVTVVGIGVANVLIPPLIKKHFSTHLGIATAGYVTAMAVGTVLPPLIATPVAIAAGWRTSLGVWVLTGALAVVPALALARSRPARAGDERLTPAQVAAAQRPRSRSTWALAALFSVASLNIFTVFAWLPHYLNDRIGISATDAGRLLSLYALTGVPGGVLIPLLMRRVRHSTVPIVVSAAAFAAGSLGLLLAPSLSPALWVGCAGLGTSLLPLTLIMINLRSPTPQDSIATSGFVQGVGYGVGALGPLVFGLLHSLTGSWTASLVLLACSAVLAPLGAIWLRTPAPPSCVTG